MILVEKLTKVYKSKKSSVKALDDISFTLPDKGMVFIVGKSGSGKSTLLNMISGLDAFTSGEITADGNALSSMSKKSREKYLSSYIGYIFQDYRLIEDFTVAQNVELAMDISGTDGSVRDYLCDVGLDEYEARLPKELSGGQKQRVAIARALAKKPRVILADEPTGNLDKSTTKEILDLLKRISQSTLVLVVSHSLRDADEYADRIIELSDGHVVKDEIRISDYENSFSVKDGVITLPHHKDLTEEEISALLAEGKDSRTVIQNTGGFQPTEQPCDIGEKIELRSKKMSKRNILKMLAIFFKRRIASKLTAVILAAIMLSVYYVIQALMLYNTNTAILNTLINTDSYGIVVQTAHLSKNNSKLVGHIPDEKIAKIDEVYDGEIHKLYTEYLFCYDRISDEDNVESSKNIAGFYSLTTYGILNTTEEYAEKVLGVDELEVLAGDLHKTAYGHVITDYVADGIITFSGGKYTCYDDLIGEYKTKNKFSYINAVVNTNYEQEHEWVKDMTLKGQSASISGTDQRYIDFISDASERYGITYNFNPDFEAAFAEYYVTYENAEFNATLTSGKISSNNIDLGIKRVPDGEYSLERGEIAMGVELYEELLEIAMSEEDVEGFTPTEVTFSHYESTGVNNIVVSHTVTVKTLVPDSDYIYVNGETLGDLMIFDVHPYSIYLDDPAKAEEAVRVVEEENLEIYSAKVNDLHYVERCIDVFGKFLNITMIFVLIASVIYLVKFGIKSIRSNIYEIGVIKAMGGMRGDISKMFISQSLLIGVGILVVTYLGMHIGAFVADKIFISSLEMATGANLYGIRTVDFYPDVALIDLAISLLVILVSAVISTRSIDKLNLISILKAKE